jgi:hypothetical protein
LESKQTLRSGIHSLRDPKAIYISNKEELILKGIYPENNHGNQKTEAGKDYFSISCHKTA